MPPLEHFLHSTKNMRHNRFFKVCVMVVSNLFKTVWLDISSQVFFCGFLYRFYSHYKSIEMKLVLPVTFCYLFYFIPPFIMSNTLSLC